MHSNNGHRECHKKHNEVGRHCRALIVKRSFEMFPRSLMGGVTTTLVPNPVRFVVEQTADSRITTSIRIPKFTFCVHPPPYPFGSALSTERSYLVLLTTPPFAGLPKAGQPPPDTFADYPTINQHIFVIWVKVGSEEPEQAFVIFDGAEVVVLRYLETGPQFPWNQTVTVFSQVIKERYAVEDDS